jgi:kynureninase
VLDAVRIKQSFDKLNFLNKKSFAEEQDSIDPLKNYRNKFFIPKQKNGEDSIYFAGNSLGLQPKSVKDYLSQELNDWAELGVDAHMNAKHPWLPYHEFLAAQTSEIVGAKPIEVVNMNSLTVNLHLMLVSFYNPSKNRFKILIESPAFPSDHYAVQSHIKFHGYDISKSLIELNPAEGESFIHTEKIIDVIRKEGESISLILLPGINYYSGQAFEFDKITKTGHEMGCIVGFDLAHGAGNLLLKLHEWEVDFAVWCSYKYLNAGPGSVAGVFINERYSDNQEIPKFWGWWGHDKATRFLMDKKFIPIPGAESWQLSNPPILSLAALRASLDIFDKAKMNNLRAKSELLTSYMQFLIDDLQNKNIEIITPREINQRGCQLSLRIKNNGRGLHEKLLSAGVVCDWREPDVIRIAPVPLYNTFSDIFNFVEILKK